MNPLEQFRLLHPGWRDLLEIAVVAYGLYRVLLLFHGTRALQIVFGIVVLILTYAAAWALKLGMITYLLGLVFTYGAFALLVVFQPELRATLAQLGQTRITRFFHRLEVGEIADAIASAVDRLSRSGIGAIIAIEREVSLQEYIPSGSMMEAKVSSDLLATIFTPYTPLHDGAVIVRGDTIIGAGCILPLSHAHITDRSLGTRHRAALGLSEESDAMVIVVSEETSTVSIAHNGRLRRDLTPLEVREIVSGRTSRSTAERAAIVESPG